MATDLHNIVEDAEKLRLFLGIILHWKLFFFFPAFLQNYKEHRDLTMCNTEICILPAERSRKALKWSLRKENEHSRSNIFKIKYVYIRNIYYFDSYLQEAH